MTDAAECGTELRLTTPAGTIMVDDLILGTGFRFDLSAAPELAGMADDIATWRDRAAGIAAPPEHEFWDLPYLGPDFAFLEKRPGTAPHLAGLTCFNHAAFLSLGYIGGDIPACSDGAPRLAGGHHINNGGCHSRLTPGTMPATPHISNNVPCVCTRTSTV